MPEDCEVEYCTQRSMVRAMCGVQLKDRKSQVLDSDVGFELNNASVGCGNFLHWHGYVLWREDSVV